LDTLKKQAQKSRNQLVALGFKDVKAEVSPTKTPETFSGVLRGKFSSLSQIPIFGQIKMWLADESAHDSKPAHSDLILQFTLTDASGIVPLGDGGSFTFRSTDADAPIIEYYPAGELDKSKHAITWKGLTAFGHEAIFKVRLLGKSYALPDK
jgi:hypothetical protein